LERRRSRAACGQPRSELTAHRNPPGRQLSQGAQSEITASLEDALDARRQRIIISESRVNWVKWSGIAALAILTFLGIAFVHSGNRSTAAIALSIFASAVAVSIILIASQDRLFGGRFGVKPSVLEQVMPQGP
jgi:hypothetical protein